MKTWLKVTLFAISTLILHTDLNGQCTITNATSCVCPTGQPTCDLLPDITISWYALDTYQSGPSEYSQSGNGANDGKLRLTGSTPNIGYGPLTVRSQDNNGDKLIVCGTDTFTVPASTTFTCPNGATPKQILRQRIYQKDGNTMNYREHLTPPMTYSNSSMYVDDWGIYSLRYQLISEPDPRKWPIVGTGKKRAFCLMDYGSCSYYNEHCRDDNTAYQGGNSLSNNDFPNWGLGNGYNCSATEQGISSGYTDIYSENLDGMWITIPPNTCNGDYWIFYEVDPHNYFEESDETNNFTLIPYTLTQQSAPGNPTTTISSNQIPMICGNDSVVLTASPGFDFLWSTGATSQSIKVAAGVYTVTVSSHCGVATSSPFTVTSLPAPPNPVTTGDSICIGQTAVLNATGSNITWFDQSNIEVGTGNTFTTPPLTVNAIYYAQDINIVPGVISNCGKPDSSGAGAFFTGSQYLIFSAIKPFILKSVKVYSNTAGNRIIEVLNSTGQLIQSGTFNIPVGEYDVPLDFNIPQGVDLRITVNGTPNLWRSSSNVTYPYTITDTLSITNSSAGISFYYFFYDWQIETGQSECLSAKIPAEAIVDICSGINHDQVNQLIRIYPNPAQNTFAVDLTATHNDENAELKILDVSGREIYKENLKLDAGKQFFKQIDITNFPKGFLVIKLIINDREYYRKLITQ